MCKVLIFSCLSAVILMTAAYGAPLTAEDCKAHLSTAEKVGLLKALISDLELLKDIDDMDHLDFYTPKYMKECGQTTLRCYQRELTLLEKEVEGQNRRHLQNIQKNLRCLEKNTSSGTRCNKCEAHDKTKFPAFHQELLTVLQSMLKEIL